MATKPVFQLSVLSQNDSGAADGNKIFCEITSITNGSLRSGSFPLKEGVVLPIPPGEDKPATPTWFLVPDTNILDTSFDVKIYCPTDAKYPTTNITVKASDVEKWGATPYNDRNNQIYQKGDYGVFGFAQEGKHGLIYTITAGVLNPKLQAY